jgi:hypothetical protein
MRFKPSLRHPLLSLPLPVAGLKAGLLKKGLLGVNIGGYVWTALARSKNPLIII